MFKRFRLQITKKRIDYDNISTYYLSVKKNKVVFFVRKTNSHQNNSYTLSYIYPCCNFFVLFIVLCMYICINGTLCFLLVFFSVSLCVVGMLMMMMRWSPFASDQIIFFFLLSVCVSLSSLQLLQCTHTKHLLLIFCYFRSFLRTLCREKILSNAVFFVKIIKMFSLFNKKLKTDLTIALISLSLFPVCFYPLSKKMWLSLKNIFYTLLSMWTFVSCARWFFYIMNGPFKKLVRSKQKFTLQITLSSVVHVPCLLIVLIVYRSFSLLLMLCCCCCRYFKKICL